MLKRLGLVGAVVGVGALAVGSVVPATGGGAGQDGDHRHTKRVFATTTEDAFIDVGRKGFSIGDYFVFSAKLTRQGEKVGHAGAVCTFTSARREEAQCAATVKLPGGQISVQGLVPSRAVFTIPITGGTGAFEAAGGTLKVRQLSETRERLTFHIIH